MVVRGTLAPVLGPRTLSCLDTHKCDAVPFDFPVEAQWTPLPGLGLPASGVPGPLNSSAYIFSAPVWQDSWTGIVLVTRRERSSMLGALDPFAQELWAALAGFLAFVACLLVALAALSGSTGRPRSLRTPPIFIDRTAVLLSITLDSDRSVHL